MWSLRRVAGAIVLTLGVLGTGLLALGLVSLLPTLESLVEFLALLPTLLALALPLAMVFVGARLMRPTMLEMSPVRPRPEPVPRVGVVDASSLKVPIVACPDCASLSIRMPQVEDGLWPGGGETGDRKVCPRCGYQGLAVSFFDAEGYAAFVAEVNDAWARRTARQVDREPGQAG